MTDPGDAAPKRALAAWMAYGAAVRGVPGELPVMAALVESGMTNLSYGQADSVGFFAMRTSIWNQGEYAGYLTNPPLQLKWFIDQALAVKAARLPTDPGYGATEVAGESGSPTSSGPRSRTEAPTSRACRSPAS